MLQIFRGSPALSEFRLNQLAVRFQKSQSSRERVLCGIYPFC
ncbi:phosphoribosylformylglycinamidine synthase [Pasteurella multocida]|nr:phosphoribosylformylglycinamidine synthase [Pasteurella multocida]